MTNVSHHQSLRKRVHLKKQKYPHPNKAIAWFDRFIIVIGVLNAAATLPQALQVWLEQDSSGLSLLTWSYYAFSSVMFLVYGVLHKEKPIIITYSATMVLYVIIVVGILFYS